MVSWPDLSAKSVKPLSIDIELSWWLGVYLMTAHCGALAGVLYSSVTVIVKAILFVAVLGSLWFCVRKYLLPNSPNRIQRIERSGSGEWTIFTLNGESKTEKLVSVFESGLFLIVRFATANGVMPVLIARDAVDATSYRELRMALREQGNTLTDDFR